MQPTVACPWCGTVYPQYQPNCSNCGGVLPHRDGASPGASPPAPPRQLPYEFVRRARRSSQFAMVFGAIFAAVGGFLALVFVILGAAVGMWEFALLGGGMGGLFFIAGLAVLGFGRRSQNRRLRALLDGIATVGQVVDVYVDQSVQVNGRSPWRVVYAFDVEGVRHEGGAHTFTPDEEYAPGVPVYVVYVAEDPGQNSLYPPLA
jgi:hypothetical protein